MFFSNLLLCVWILRVCDKTRLLMYKTRFNNHRHHQHWFPWTLSFSFVKKQSFFIIFIIFFLAVFFVRICFWVSEWMNDILANGRDHLWVHLGSSRMIIASCHQVDHPERVGFFGCSPCSRSRCLNRFTGMRMRQVRDPCNGHLAKIHTFQKQLFPTKRPFLLGTNQCCSVLALYWGIDQCSWIFFDQLRWSKMLGIFSSFQGIYSSFSIIFHKYDYPSRMQDKNCFLTPCRVFVKRLLFFGVLCTKQP